LKNEIIDSYPSTEKFFNEKNPLFLDYVDKLGIMFRENLRRAFMNLTRQRRSYKRYFEDCTILLSEANFTDD